MIKILFPIRCFTCGKVIAHLWEEYKARVDKGEDPAKILDSFGVKRYCCRRIFLTHVDLFEKIAKFKP